MAERIRIMNFGIQWPPYTHGRVVCTNCTTVVAACACSQACQTVGTVEACPKCTPQREPIEREPAPATKYHDARDRYQNDARFHGAVDAITAIALNAGFTPGEIQDAGILAAIIIETKYARPFLIVPRAVCDERYDELRKRV